jgi:hypothetical protein
VHTQLVDELWQAVKPQRPRYLSNNKMLRDAPGARASSPFMLQESLSLCTPSAAVSLGTRAVCKMLAITAWLYLPKSKQHMAYLDCAGRQRPWPSSVCRQRLQQHMTVSHLLGT